MTAAPASATTPTTPASTGDLWSVVPTPSPYPADNVLSGVSCVSASFCLAVGGGSLPPGPGDSGARSGSYAETWDGTSWALVGDPGGFVQSVSCVTPTFCMAVGSTSSDDNDGEPYADIWDGSGWQSSPVAVPPLDPNGTAWLAGVSCLSSTNCVAVGSYRQNGILVVKALTERWAGGSWAIGQEVDPDSLTALSSVSCSDQGGQVCMAVGSFRAAPTTSVPKTIEHTVIETSSDGSDWSVAETVDAVATNLSYFAGVSCSSATQCEAVGNYQIGQGGGLPSRHLVGPGVGAGPQPGRARPGPGGVLSGRSGLHRHRVPRQGQRVGRQQLGTDSDRDLGQLSPAQPVVRDRVLRRDGPAGSAAPGRTGLRLGTPYRQRLVEGHFGAHGRSPQHLRLAQQDLPAGGRGGPPRGRRGHRAAARRGALRQGRGQPPLFFVPGRNDPMPAYVDSRPFTGHPFEQKCGTGCSNIAVYVREQGVEEHPVPGATVKLQAYAVAPEDATYPYPPFVGVPLLKPEGFTQFKGELCVVVGVQEKGCSGSGEAKTTTDGQGIAYFRYWAPGMVKDGTVLLTATATDSTPSCDCRTGHQNANVYLSPDVVFDAYAPLTQQAVDYFSVWWENKLPFDDVTWATSIITKALPELGKRTN